MTKYEFDKLRLGFLTAIRDEYALKTEETNDALNVFRQWLLDKGEKFIRQIVDGNDKNISQKNLLLANACIVWRGDRLNKRQGQGFFAKNDYEKKMITFVNELWTKGKSILRKGYAGKSISDDDCGILNLYRILAETHILGIPVWEYEVNKESAKNNPYRIAGSTISLPNLPTLQEVLSSQSYSDKLPEPSLNLVSNETHNDFIPLLNAFDRNKNSNNSEIKSNGKPTCLIVTAAADCFWPRCSPDAEYFKRSYGYEMNFLWINIRLWDFMIQIDNTFANQPEKELYASIETLEERARTSKAFFLRQPWLSLPCKLDLPSDICANLFQCPGGEAEVLLLDKNNNLVWRSAKGWGHWFNTRPSAPWLTDNVSWADEIEQQIQSLLKTGKSKNNEDYFPPPKAEEDKIAEGSYKAYLLPSRVVSIDIENKTIELKGRPVVRFSVILHEPDTYDECNPMLNITLHYKEKSLLFRNKPFVLKKLEIGDIVGGWIERKETGPWICSSVNITKKVNDKPSKQIKKRKAIIHCFGEFISYDYENKFILVKLKHNNSASIGEKFINENPDDYELSYGTQIYCDNFANKEIDLKLKISPDSLFRKNGFPCLAKGFQLKDKVRVEFVFEDNNDEYTLRLLRGAPPNSGD